MAGGAKWIAQPCGCLHEQFVGAKRPRKCDCGNVFQSEKALKSQAERRAAPTRTRSSQPDRDWKDAREKVDHEEVCRICKKPAGPERPIEAAHVLGREHDKPRHPGSRTLYVDPDRIFPACGPFPAGCHGLVHQKAVDILPVLTLEEQVRAVKDAGGIRHALTLLAPVEHREEVEASAYTEAA